MVATRARVSEAEFLALPETTQRIEFLDGEVIVGPAPSVKHQDVVGRLYIELNQWADSRTPRPRICLSPLDVRLRTGRIVQPDVFTFLEPTPELTSPIDRIPDLCIEVLSTDRVYDRITKRAVYGEAGVREYWAVDVLGAVERFFDEGLRSRVELTETLESPLLPGFKLSIPHLCRP